MDLQTTVRWVGHIPHIGTAGNSNVNCLYVLEENIKIGLVEKYIEV